MTERPINRLIKSLEEAVGYARGDCEHEWVRLRRTSLGGVISVCPKCKVQVTTYEEHADDHR